MPSKSFSPSPTGKGTHSFPLRTFSYTSRDHLSWSWFFISLPAGEAGAPVRAPHSTFSPTLSPPHPAREGARPPLLHPGVSGKVTQGSSGGFSAVTMMGDPHGEEPPFLVPQVSSPEGPANKSLSPLAIRPTPDLLFFSGLSSTDGSTPDLGWGMRGPGYGEGELSQGERQGPGLLEYVSR